jgi:hypothetical protein
MVLQFSVILDCLLDPRAQKCADKFTCQVSYMAQKIFYSCALGYQISKQTDLIMVYNKAEWPLIKIE